MAGIINKYISVIGLPTEISNDTRVETKIEKQAFVLHDDVKQIALADKEVLTERLLEGYNLSKYRRQKIEALLLPNITVAFDKIIQAKEFAKENECTIH